MTLTGRVLSISLNSNPLPLHPRPRRPVRRHGCESETLLISGIPNHGNLKKAILDIKSILCLGVSEAKELADKIVESGKAEFTLKNEWEAEDAKNKFTDLGFKVKRVWRKVC